jgi:methylmalonyl-CoA mutase
MDDVSFATDFPTASREQWLALVAAVLKGASFEEKLVAHSYDRIAIGPLYAKAQGPDAALHGARRRWRIAQRVDHPDPKVARDFALADLEGGADALTLVFSSAASARGFGVSAHSPDQLDEALDGVMLDLVQMRLDAGRTGPAAAAMMIALAERRGYSLAELDIDLGLDPVAAMASSGALGALHDLVTPRAAETLADLQRRGFNGRTFLADGRPYHEAGASEAQELAAVLATALAYLRTLEDGGHKLAQGRDALSFLLVADADEFLTVAKFRALRRLWTHVEAACGLAPKPIRLHAETAWRMTTRRDPWVNMLRATVAVFSAAIGGADTIAVLPFTAALGLPDALARRIARNTQLILAEEANLWRVADPVAGAGGFEALTDALCERAWALFQELEHEGGIVASLRSGALQARVAAVREEREQAVATRRDPITGTSAFPDLGEMPVSVLLPSPRWRRPDVRRSVQRVTPTPGSEKPGPMEGQATPDAALEDSEPVLPPLPSIRSAEPYERLRDLSDAYQAETGGRPKVFLANLGSPAEFGSRAAFAKNFFAAGGVEAVINDGFASQREMLDAFTASRAKLICICGSDLTYESSAVSTIKALLLRGATQVYVTGRPDRLKEPLRDAGVSGYIFAGCNALATLEDAVRNAIA